MDGAEPTMFFNYVPSEQHGVALGVVEPGHPIDSTSVTYVMRDVRVSPASEVTRATFGLEYNNASVFSNAEFSNFQAGPVLMRGNATLSPHELLLFHNFSEDIIARPTRGQTITGIVRYSINGADYVEVGFSDRLGSNALTDDQFTTSQPWSPGDTVAISWRCTTGSAPNVYGPEITYTIETP